MLLFMQQVLISKQQSRSFVSNIQTKPHEHSKNHLYECFSLSIAWLSSHNWKPLAVGAERLWLGKDYTMFMMLYYSDRVHKQPSQRWNF